MSADARISIQAAFDHEELSNLRVCGPGDLELLYDALEEFLSDGHPDELRALHRDDKVFAAPLDSLEGHLDHLEARTLLRRAATAFNDGHDGATFGMQIDLDESFGPAGSQGDWPRPHAWRQSCIDGAVEVEMAYALHTFEEDEPIAMVYEVEDVVDEASDEEDPLVGLGLRDQEVQFVITLRYRLPLEG